MKVEMRALDSIKPYEKNAKKHDQTQIDNVAESIRQYGFVQPIVVDRDGVIVIGHCRALGAKKLGLKEVPCVCVDDLTPEQVNALRLVDNKSSESDWDFDLLADELSELDLSAFDFDFGFEVNEQGQQLSYIDELLEDENCMTNNNKLEREEFSISFCFPKQYEDAVKGKIKEMKKKFYSKELLKIIGVL